MRVIFDDRWRKGGIGRFAVEVVSRLRKSGTEISNLELCNKIADPFGPLAIRNRLRGVSGDVFWSPGFLPPVSANIPVVITIHDLIHRRYGGWKRKLYYDGVLKPLVRRVDTILTVSEYSKNMIADWLGGIAPPIVVVGNGVSSEFTVSGDKYRAKDPYALYCGNHRSHKNIGRMLEGFRMSQADSSLFLGMTGNPDQATTSLIQQYGLTDRVFWLGASNESQLAAAYRGAEFLILVSLEEGFGLPVIEAMACGTPVLCSDSSALSEVAADVALTVDPHDKCSIADGISRIYRDQNLRDRMSKNGILRAADFNWDDVAKRINNALESVVRT